MSTQMNIQVISDIHLEDKETSLLPQDIEDFIYPSSNYLIIAGDVHELKDNNSVSIFVEFMKYQSERFDMIFYVLGNHEYYYGNVKGRYEYIKDLVTSVSDNIIILNNSSYTINNIEIYGTTLWSEIPRSIRKYKGKVMENTKKVFTTVKDMNIEKYNELHYSAVKRLDEFLNNRNGKRKIVVTHHAPLVHGTIRPENKNDVYECMYVTNLSHLVSLADVWIFGHTHRKVERYHNNTLILSNPVGYKYQKTGYDNQLTIDIE